MPVGNQWGIGQCKDTGICMGGCVGFALVVRAEKKGRNIPKCYCRKKMMRISYYRSCPPNQDQHFNQIELCPSPVRRMPYYYKTRRLSLFQNTTTKQKRKRKKNQKSKGKAS